MIILQSYIRWLVPPVLHAYKCLLSCTVAQLNTYRASPQEMIRHNMMQLHALLRFDKSVANAHMQDFTSLL